MRSSRPRPICATHQAATSAAPPALVAHVAIRP